MARLEMLINTNNSTASNNADRSDANLNSPYSDSDEEDKKLITASSNLEEIPVSPILPRLATRQNSFEEPSPINYEEDPSFMPNYSPYNE